MANAIVEITGAIYRIGEAHKFGREQMWKRKFWVKEVNVKYPNFWGLEMWHENTSLLNEYKQSQVVVCRCIVMGRQYTPKNGTGEEDSYTILQCIEIKHLA